MSSLIIGQDRGKLTVERERELNFEKRQVCGRQKTIRRLKVNLVKLFISRLYHKPYIVGDVCCRCRVRGHDDSSICWPRLLSNMFWLLFLFLFCWLFYTWWRLKGHA